MKQITIKDIQDLDPCYPPTKYLAVDWTGTIVDILGNKEIPAKDRLWVVVRHQFLNDATLHRYGLACARMCEKNTTDERVKACNDVVEAYLNGTATKDELSAAELAARSAAELAARSAAWSAARSAESAARSAESAARSAAESAESAAWSAAWSAKESAWSAESARSAWSTVEEEQCSILVDIIQRFS